MSYNTDPTAKYIQRFKKRMETQWSNQDKQDEVFTLLDQMRNKFTVASASDNAQGLRAGIVGMLTDEDGAILTVTPFTHFNPVSDKREDKKLASEVLEPWMASALQKSQVGRVWVRKPRAMRFLGRVWSFCSHDPRIWYDDPEYQDLLEAFKDAKEDTSEYTEAKKNIEAFKRDHWPFIWRWVDTRNTWTYFTDRRWLPEVIEIREMTIEEIEDSYGKSAVPEEYRNEKPEKKLDVYQYANWFYCATAIGATAADNAKLAYKWAHGLGTNPYVLMESELMSENDQGIRWKPAMFYAKDLAQEFDKRLSDLSWSAEENTRRGLIQYIDKEDYEEDAKVAGRPKVIEAKNGETIAMWLTEKVEQSPVIELSQQVIYLMEFLYRLIRENAMRPVERGESKAGDSGNKFATQTQIAEREFDPSMQAIRDGWLQVSKIHLRGVLALNKEFPEHADKVSTFGSFLDRDNLKVVRRLVEVGPQEVRGQENAMQVRAERAIPIDDTAKVSVATAKANLGVPKAMYFTDDLGIENDDLATRIDRREKLEAAVFEQVIIPGTVARSTVVMQSLSPQQQTEMNQALPQASPAVQQVVAPEMTLDETIPGGNLQGQANVRRTNGMQAPQQGPQVIGG